MVPKEKKKFDLEEWIERTFGSKSPTANMRHNAHVAFESFTGRFNLVSRKEFDALKTSLNQAVRKLNQLEKQLSKKVATKPITKKVATKKTTPAKK